jgi:hypothetical protein
MDALVKFCESEFRLRKQQNPQLKGFDLRPVQYTEWVQKSSIFPNSIRYDVSCSENEILIATEAAIIATPPNATPNPSIDNAILALSKKSSIKPEEQNLSVLFLSLRAGNRASIFETTNVGFISTLFNTTLTYAFYIRAFRLSFYS